MHWRYLSFFIDRYCRTIQSAVILYKSCITSRIFSTKELLPWRHQQSNTM